MKLQKNETTELSKKENKENKNLNVREDSSSQTYVDKKINLTLEKNFFILKKLIIDENFINKNRFMEETKKDIQKEETKEEIKEAYDDNINNNSKDKDKGIIKLKCKELKLNANSDIGNYASYHERDNDKYLTPTKEKSNSIYSERGKKIIKKIRVEKKNKDKKLPKHFHQEKKDRNEEIHMSDFKEQNSDKMDIIGEVEEEIEEKKQIEQNVNEEQKNIISDNKDDKNNEDKNKDNKENEENNKNEENNNN